MRLVLRPLLSFVVLVALAIALLQGVGRVAFMLLDRLEPAVNQMLAGRQVRVAGLRGDWRGFNPVVRMARLDLPAGHVEDVYVELDLLESLIRSRAVLHRARVADAALLLERTEDGRWRLAGMPRGDGFDPLPYLTETDQLQFDGAFGFIRDEFPTAEFAVAYVGTNRDGFQRHRLVLRNGAEDCVAPCELRIDLARAAAEWGLGAPDVAVTVSATRFLVGEVLLGFGALQLDAVELDWREGSNAASGGRALVAVSGTLARDGRPFAARLDALGRSRDGHRWARFGRFELEHDGARVTLPPLALAERNGVVHASLSELPVAETLALARSALAGTEVAARWLRALAIDGRATDLRAFYRIESGELGYGVELAGFQMDGYRGVPMIRNGAGSVIGHTRLLTGRPQAEVGNLVQIDMAGVDMRVAFPDQVRAEWDLPHARGRLQAFFRRDELGFSGTGIETRIGDSSIRGSVAVSRIGREEPDRRLAAVAVIDRMEMTEARRFVPYTLQPRLYEWLTTTPMDGVLVDARIAYQGQFRVASGELGRRLEIATRVEDGRIRFLPDWPVVEGFQGAVEVAGREVRAAAVAAASLGADLAGTRFRLGDGGRLANVDLAASADAAAMFALVRGSPLQRWLPFVAPDWSGSGPLRVNGTLAIPLREMRLGRDGAGQADAPAPVAREAGRASAIVSAAGAGSAPPDGAGPAGVVRESRDAAPAGLAVDLAFELAGVDLDLPGYRLRFDDLTGPLGYRYPDQLESTGIAGALFDAPVRITAGGEAGRIGLQLAGTARAEDIWQVLDLADPGVAAGAARFDARLDLAAPAGAAGRGVDAAPPRLSIRSGLEGMTLRLPAQYAKLPEDADALEVDLAFPDARRRMTFRFRDAAGWLEFDPRLARGSIGLGVEPLALAEGERSVVITGALARLAMDDLPPRGSMPGTLPVSIEVRGLDVERIALGRFETRAARLDGELGPSGFDVRLASERLDLRARRAIAPDAAASAGVAAPIDLVVEDLWLPPGSGRGDPLSVDVIATIPDVNVVIERMTVGEADYGAWRFEMRQENGDLWLRKLEGSLRGVEVVGGDGLVWRSASNETTFDGELRMGNLADVLPLWGYAPSVSSERARLWGSVGWSGSPAAFDLLGLRGEAQVRADNGRFLDVETGGGTQRILSLLNFTTIAKRMTFDFSDVFGKGLSFDRLKATLGFDRGILSFVRPLDVEGTGLKFRMTGSVRLEERALDHEMIVTLPVSRGLPWYAAYVGLANPIAGLGVLVGERVLRKPLEQFSSAKYRITGTVENPQVELVSVFDSTASERPVEVPVEDGPSGPMEVPAHSADEPAPDATGSKE